MTLKSVKFLVFHLRNKRGQGMTEYVLILGFLVLAVISSLTPIGPEVAKKFTQMAVLINGAN